jgi:magnesium-transporting ATPase (P-type)
VVQRAQLPSETKSALNFSLFKNYWLLGGLLLGNILHLAVIYTESMNLIFHTVPIPLTDFFLIGAVASSVLWVEEIRKWVARRRRITCSMSPQLP